MVEDIVPVTRLRMAESALGSTKVTEPFAPTEKLFQSITALDEVCLMASALPAGVPIVPCPDVIVPPFGSTACASARTTNATTEAQANRTAVDCRPLSDETAARMRINTPPMRRCCYASPAAHHGDR